MSDQLPILIVGAGPSGLTMAIALHRYGIPLRIIEKRATPTQTSNAAAIHSRTMEMLDDMNIIENFLKRGQRIEFMNLRRGAHRLARIPTSQIESLYNYVLTIPQNVSEEILNYELNKMNHQVEREKTLTNIEPLEEGIIATVITPNEQSEKIHCRYLIAADGAHSTIRELLKIEFNGIDIPQQFVLGDVQISTHYPDNEASIYFHDEGPFAVFPFRKGHARIVASIAKKNRDPKQPVSLLELQDIASKRTLNQFNIENANWMSSFWIHSKMIQKFRKENIFFIGDSAHIHSPVGGQGMNTGMQDAYNLAWKIALTLQGYAKPSLLESYNEEREPNAVTLLKNTERMTHLLLLKNPLLLWLRRKLMPFLLKERHLQHAFLMEVSMLSLHYEKSSIINYEFHVDSKSPLPGHKAPDIYFVDRNGPKRLNDLLRSTRHTALIFTGIKADLSCLQKLRKIEQWALDRNTFINPIIIVHPKLANEFSDKDVADKNGDLHAAYHAEKPCYFMIRPDNYIGCCSSDLSLDLLNKYWIQIFH